MYEIVNPFEKAYRPDPGDGSDVRIVQALVPTGGHVGRANALKVVRNSRGGGGRATKLEHYTSRSRGAGTLGGDVKKGVGRTKEDSRQYRYGVGTGLSGGVALSGLSAAPVAHRLLGARGLAGGLGVTAAGAGGAAYLNHKRTNARKLNKENRRQAYLGMATGLLVPSPVAAAPYVMSRSTKHRGRRVND